MQAYGELTVLLEFLPLWAQYLIAIVTVTWTVCMAGIVIGKTGRNPYWAVLGFLPYTMLIGLWVLALRKWPRVEQARKI